MKPFLQFHCTYSQYEVTPQHCSWTISSLHTHTLGTHRRRRRRKRRRFFPHCTAQYCGSCWKVRNKRKGDRFESRITRRGKKEYLKDITTGSCSVCSCPSNSNFLSLRGEGRREWKRRKGRGEWKRRKERERRDEVGVREKQRSCNVKKRVTVWRYKQVHFCEYISTSNISYFLIRKIKILLDPPAARDDHLHPPSCRSRHHTPT